MKYLIVIFAAILAYLLSVLLPVHSIMIPATAQEITPETYSITLRSDKLGYNANEIISLSGLVRNSTNPMDGVVVILEVLREGTVVHRDYVITDSEGNFSYAFMAVAESRLIIMAKLAATERLSPALISVNIIDSDLQSTPPDTLVLIPSKHTASINEEIVLAGQVMGTSNVARTIIVEAKKDSKLLYNSSTLTNSQGAFRESFQIPEQGTITVNAKLVGEQVSSTITIVIERPLWPIIVSVAPIIAAFGFVMLSPHKHVKRAFFVALVSTAIGYSLLYSLKPLDDTGNTVLATVFLAPVAGYTFEYSKKKREAENALESTTASYRNEKLKTEVESLIKFSNEISKHASRFKATVDDDSSILSDDVYKVTPTVGTMANLPGLLINRYYRYLSIYNKCLQAKLAKTGALTNPAMYDKFVGDFQALKNDYLEVNDVIYVHMIYGIGEIHQTFLSFPTISFPIRTSWPLVTRLRKVGVLCPDQTESTDMYSRKSALALIAILRVEFDSKYSALEEQIEMIIKTYKIV